LRPLAEAAVNASYLASAGYFAIKFADKIDGKNGRCDNCAGLEFVAISCDFLASEAED
jgi:hypothetical protein